MRRLKKDPSEEELARRLIDLSLASEDEVLRELAQRVVARERSKYLDVQYERFDPNDPPKPGELVALTIGPNTAPADWITVGRPRWSDTPVQTRIPGRVYAWRKLFGRLAGAPEVSASFTQRPIGSADGAIAVTAALIGPDGTRDPVFTEIIRPGNPAMRRHVVSPANRDHCHARSAQCGPGFSLVLSYGWCGGSTDETKAWTTRLPVAKREAQKTVTRELSRLNARIRPLIRRRCDLEYLLADAVSYLLVRRYKASPPHSWASAARVYYGLREVPRRSRSGSASINAKTESSRYLSSEIEAMRARVKAADRRVANWRRIGQP